MKLTHTERAERVTPDNAKKSGSALSSRLAAYAFSGLCAISIPLIDGYAHAQPQAPPEAGQAVPTAQPSASSSTPTTTTAQAPQQPPAVPTTVPAVPQTAQAPALQTDIFTVAGDRAVIHDGANNIEGYAIIRGQRIPIITITGPARFTVRIHPNISKSLFTPTTTEVSRSVDFTLGQVGSVEATRTQSVPGLSSQTSRTVDCANTQGTLASCIDPATSVLGTPITVTRSVPAGRYMFSVIGPNGVMEVVSVERVITRPPEEILPPVPVTRPGTTPGASTPRVPAEEPEFRPVFLSDGSWLRLRGIGPLASEGDMFSTQLLANIAFNDNWAILAGAVGSSHRLTLVTPEAQSDLRSISIAAAAGVSYRFSRQHMIYALGFGGWRGMDVNTVLSGDGRVLDTMEHQGEGGGQLGYIFNEYFMARITASNNPFVPVSGQIYASLPYWFWPGALDAKLYPWAEINLMWLRTMNPLSQAGRVGAYSLDGNDFYMHAYAGLPIYGIGPVTLFGLAGGELNGWGGNVYSGAGIFGGGLTGRFLDNHLIIEAAGGASTHGDPLVLLRVNYSR